MTAVPSSPTMRFEVVTADGVSAAILVGVGERRQVRRRADAGPWAVQYCCQPERVVELVEVLATDAAAIGSLGLPLRSCVLRVGARHWPVSPFDEIDAGLWAAVPIPEGGDVTVVSELVDSPVGTAVVALHLGAGREPVMTELGSSAARPPHGGLVHCATRAWVQRACWARGLCTTGALALASRPRPGTDWRVYETLNGYYHADELDRGRLPPLPTAMRTWYRETVPDA
jgi:hypothetical protein